MPKGVKQNTPEKIEQRKHGMKLPENAAKDRRWTREEIIPIVEKIILSDPDIVFFYDVWAQTPFQKDWYYKFLNRNVDKRTLNRIKKFFKTEDDKTMILGALYM